MESLDFRLGKPVKCFVREKRAQLTHGKELSTGMDGSIPLLLRLNVGNRLPGHEKGSARLSDMSPKAQGLLSFLMSLMRL